MSNEIERRIAFLASAVEQANNTIRAKMDELSLVRRVGDAISHHTSIWSLSSELVDAIAETVNCKYALMYAGSDASPFELQAVSSIFSGAEQFPHMIGQTQIVRYLEQGGSPILITNISHNAIWSEEWPLPKTLASWLCVPLLTRNHLRGILCLADDAPAAFDEKTLRTLMVVVPQISSAFSNIGLYNHLRESETKYRTLVTGMQDVVYICDRDWLILDANPAAEGLFGGSIIGKTLTELFSSPNTASQFVEAVRISRTVQNFETEMRTSTSGRIVALLSCVTDGGRYSGIIKDMTERIHLMEQVTRAQKMESIGTLASGVAHDFNNILGIILPNAELIKMRTEPSSPATRFADIIINASKRAAQLTRQLLSLSRKDPITWRIVSLNEAIRATGKLLSETLDRNIRLEFELSTDSTSIKADETQVEQVVLNLAINARDAMPEGGLLKFTTRVAGDRVTVRVADSGMGIDREILPKIFDPFFTTKDKSKGTGLGLSVVYGIVKQIGGTIDVKSEVGAGTEFLLTFPSCQEARRKVVHQAPAPAGGSEKILIADDEPEMLNLLETALKDLGYSVLSARNGIEAVQYATDDIRLIILDMIMPEMDGVGALRAIRRKTPDMKVLISSGYTSPEKTPLLEALGIDGFVQKPFELVKLAATVRDVLDGVAV
ncbi:MAG TPA: ATP-binding protein [Terriglobia bacterium]|nr:ATP-binding protein [Terriglobia bacterium]